MVDVAALVAPLSDEEGQRAGPDLSYSNERGEIEAPFILDANGGEVEERAWRDSVRLILAEAQLTRDIWLAIYLTRGGAKIGDLQTVADGAEMLAGLMENLWADVHPTLDEADFVGRKTPCDSLTRIREFLAPMRRVALFEHRMGKVTGEDLERFASEGASAEGYAQFRAAIDTNDAERAEEIRTAFADALGKLDAIRDSLKRVDAVLVANAGSETGTNFTPTYETLAAIRSAAQPYAGIADEASVAESGGADATAYAGEAGMVATGGGPALSGRVNSREDVLRAIDAITDYYKAREPGHPVPVLMKRARHWVAMDFMELLEDLVPDSLTNARTVLLAKQDMPEQGYGY